MIGQMYDQAASGVAYGMGPRPFYLASGGMATPEDSGGAASGGAVGSSGGGAVLLSWGILAAILVAGYLFFAPITL